MKVYVTIFTIVLCLGCMVSCGNKNKTVGVSDTIQAVTPPDFEADSAYSYLVRQCDFGPRVVNSDAHKRCGDYIVDYFKRLGLQVVEQEAVLTRYDGEKLNSRNIIASYASEKKERILVCAHWDSRPWADNDPNEANHKKPILGANDGASGVAVMMEIARLLQEKKPSVGIDFVCFDAEDCGVPQWAETNDNSEESWCLGSQYWASHPHVANYKARFGILLDMVGGRGASFYQEGFSLRYARDIVTKVWNAAERAGYGSFFPKTPGGYITDDHVPVNKTAGIPTIDIVPYYDELSGSSFGPTWHTVNDTPENIDPNTLKAVGQTVMQVIYEEK